MSDSICNDPAYKNMILQKQRFQLMNIPPIRYNNLANNPYDRNYPGTSTKFTKFDLDMRRKVEILKYYANNSSTQTNRFTKAEIYAQAVSGKYQQRTYPNSYINDNSLNNQLIPCPSIKTPTSACGVPGPIMYLYEDNNVPLYNYTTNIDSNYGILTQGINPFNKTWDYTNDSNKTVITNTNTNEFTSIITSLFIYYGDVPTRTFTITTPIALTFEGIVTTQTPPKSMTFKINAVLTNILYNNTPYQQIVSSYPTNTITVTPTEVNNYTFSGTCYLGVITIITTLPIQKGYIFDIQPIVKYTNTPTNVTVSSLKCTFNVSNFTRSTINCQIVGDINPPIISPMLVT